MTSGKMQYEIPMLIMLEGTGQYIGLINSHIKGYVFGSVSLHPSLIRFKVAPSLKL
jgi:hypothetical protein